MKTPLRRLPSLAGLLTTTLAAGLLTAAAAPADTALGQAATAPAPAHRQVAIHGSSDAALPAALAAATRYAPTGADRRLATQLTARATTARFGSAFTGAVVDAASNTVVWSKNGTTARMPASTTKLVTATDALTVFGGGHRFTTTVKAGPHADQVILVGSGDPALTSAQLSTLAKSTATKLKAAHHLRVRVYADDFLFAAPSRAIGWKTSYIPGDTTWLRALVVDGRQVPDTSIDAAKIFAGKLAANGISVATVSRGRAAKTAPVLAASAGQTLSATVSSMMMRSDNEYAEALHRLVAIKTGYGNTWTAGRRAQTNTLSRQGLTVNALYDGSGLSRADRVSGIQMARVVANAFEPANRTSLALLRNNSGLPVSGKTGTLRASYGRFTTPASRCAVGKVHAKTGTLDDVVALSGWAVGKDGRVKTFAFVVNGKAATMAVKQNVDMLAATVTGCY